LRWFHNFEALAATLSLPSLAHEPNPFAPHSWCRIRGPYPPLWDAGAPQSAIGVPRTRLLPHDRITYLSYTTSFPLCYFVHICSCSTWPRVVKRVPCHVLETRMSHVMDGRVVSRGLCLTLGNPEPQPSCLAMDIAASPVHAS
jgi:hypothetical protein